MAGQEISYFDAWSAWADGIDIRQRVLWGLEIYWWARWAKVGAFAASLIIVVDIIGIERLERWFQRRKVLTRAHWIMRYSWMVQIVRRAKPPGIDHKPTKVVIAVNTLMITAQSTITIGILAANRNHFQGFGWLASIPLFLVLFLAVTLGMGLVMILIAWVTGNALGLAVAVTLEFLDAMSRSGAFAYRVRLTALLLLLYAFHFDILAS
ncbi:hypothetical protein AB0G05_11380 [Nonomuraea wenchangensis]